LSFNLLLQSYLQKEKTVRVISYREQDILPSTLALTVYIQLSLMISFLVINYRAMGSTSMNHGDGHMGINDVKN
jgi:hypothetical protein